MSKQQIDASVFEYSITYFNTEFEDILGKIIICYNLMIVNGIVLPNDENQIRNELTFNYLNKNEIREQIGIGKYLFEPESPTKNNSGRTDIKIISERTFEDTDAYYIIECKRLDSKNQRGKSGLNGEYVSNGIARFVMEGKYPFYNNTAGMIGFIVSKMDIHKNMDFINQLLQNTFTEINTERELTQKQIIPDFEYSYYSQHKVDNTTKTIYHVMFNFSDNINETN
jgi:hypothetical protein